MTAATGGGRCAFTVDVEEWFQVSALEPHIERRHWGGRASRVERPVRQLLELLARHERRATFFVLGWIAERHSGLVRAIAGMGHEVANHGYAHRLVGTQTEDEFRADVARTRGLLSDLIGRDVLGYRAPSFSIGDGTPWAYRVLAETGHIYSPSAHPVINDHYGRCRDGAVPRRCDGVLEVPVVTLGMGPWRLPCGGGAWFRLLPEAWTRWALARARQQGVDPAVFYIHPWELDPDQPRLPGLPISTRARHYGHLDRTTERVARLIAALPWEPLGDVLPKAPG